MSRDQRPAKVSLGTEAFLDWMKTLAHEIDHAAMHGSWLQAEIKAAQFLRMCEMRRQRP